MKKERCNYYKNSQVWNGGDLAAPIIVLEDTGTVLDDAWALVAEGNLPIWGSVLAKSQSEGRGQTRRHWQSPEGNLYAALRLPMESPFDSTAAAPALSALIIKKLNKISYGINLKWPNDLICANKLQKVGGILLEERQGVIIAGIGINLINAPRAELLREGAALPAGILSLSDKAEQSLTSCNNVNFSSEISLSERLWLYLARSMYFCYTNSLTRWTDVWQAQARDYLLWKGQEVCLQDTDNTVNGIVLGLGPEGQLKLLVHGHEQYFFNGSVSSLKG